MSNIGMLHFKVGSTDGVSSVYNLMSELETENSLRHLVFDGYRQLLQVRITHPAFHPNGAQQILHLYKSVFAVLRKGENGRFSLLCLQNVSPHSHTLTLTPHHSNISAIVLKDLLNSESFSPINHQVDIPLSPYQTRWLSIT